MRGLLALLTTALVAASLTPAAAAPVSGKHPSWPGLHYCGSFQSDYKIYVYKKGITCRKAMRIQREYWNGKRADRVTVNGGTGAAGYTVLKKFPGWKCGSGSGGGSCNKGKATAAYQN